MKLIHTFCLFLNYPERRLLFICWVGSIAAATDITWLIQWNGFFDILGSHFIIVFVNNGWLWNFRFFHQLRLFFCYILLLSCWCGRDSRQLNRCIVGPDLRIVHGVLQCEHVFDGVACGEETVNVRVGVRLARTRRVTPSQHDALWLCTLALETICYNQDN